MTIIDISRTLRAEIAVWPGDPPFQLESMASLAEGAVVNVTRLVVGAHAGTHVDAPHHFTENATTIEALDLAVYCGPAQVVTVNKTGGPLLPADLAGYDLSLAPRLLVRSSASELPESEFPAEFVYPDPELAAFLGRQGIILYGTDCPSVDPFGSELLLGHHALQAAQILILESLKLDQVADGLYELLALPLKVAGGDGSPVRAVLRPWGK